MKKTLTIILLLLSTILYSQTKVVITTEEGKIGKYFENYDSTNQVIYNLYCLNSMPECNFTLYLTNGDYGYISEDYKRLAWFRVLDIGVFVLQKSDSLNFTIKQE